jgi:hypothetical protein
LEKDFEHAEPPRHLDNLRSPTRVRHNPENGVMKPHPARRHSKAHSTRTKEVHWVENASPLSTAKTRHGLVAMILVLETGLRGNDSHDEEPSQTLGLALLPAYTPYLVPVQQLFVLR